MTSNVVLLGLVSYLTGSIPFGLMLSKALRGIDLRDHGSGNIGATNAGRVLGKKWGLVCLALDALKGLVPVLLLPPMFFGADNPNLVHLRILTGVATIVGHMFPCWLGFRGGKGVATSLGVVLMLSPWGLLFGAVAFFSSLTAWRYVSLSSMLAAIGFGASELIRLKPSPFAESTWSQGLFAIMVPLLIILQHRTNIVRLIKREEPRFSFK